MPAKVLWTSYQRNWLDTSHTQVTMGMQNLRAHSLFQPSNLAKAIADTMDEEGNTVSHLYGSIMALPHTVVARTSSVLGFDFIMLDALHTYVDFATID